ncbi:MAG: hypothetical protein ABIV39_10930 [Verrucomicrobiota bacterium]
MKILSTLDSWAVVATFGSAQLLGNQSGKVEMRGGTNSDRLSALEWIFIFMHEAVPRIQPN